MHVNKGWIVSRPASKTLIKQPQFAHTCCIDRRTQSQLVTACHDYASIESSHALQPTLGQPAASSCPRMISVASCRLQPSLAQSLVIKNGHSFFCNHFNSRICTTVVVVNFLLENLVFTLESAPQPQFYKFSYAYYSFSGENVVLKHVFQSEQNFAISFKLNHNCKLTEFSFFITCFL